MRKKINLTHENFVKGTTLLSFKNLQNILVLKNHNHAEFPLARVTNIIIGDEPELEVEPFKTIAESDKKLLNDAPHFELGGEVLSREGNLIKEFRIYEVSICP